MKTGLQQPKTSREEWENMSEANRLTFMQYKNKLENSHFCVVGSFLRNFTIEEAIVALENPNITENNLEEFITRRYTGVTAKSGHIRWHMEGEEDCHRYYYGKNIFVSVIINNIEYLLHYNKGDGEGVYINY